MCTCWHVHGHWRPHPGAQLRKKVGLNQVAMAHVLAGNGGGHTDGRQGLHLVKAAACRVATDSVILEPLQCTKSRKNAHALRMPH